MVKDLQGEWIFNQKRIKISPDGKATDTGGLPTATFIVTDEGKVVLEIIGEDTLTGELTLLDDGQVLITSATGKSIMLKPIDKDSKFAKEIVGEWVLTENDSGKASLIQFDELGEAHVVTADKKFPYYVANDNLISIDDVIYDATKTGNQYSLSASIKHRGRDVVWKRTLTPVTDANRKLALTPVYEQAITNNLRQIASAGQQFILEEGESMVSYPTLEGEYFAPIKSVAGENYKTLKVHGMGGKITVTTDDDIRVTYTY